MKKNNTLVITDILEKFKVSARLKLFALEDVSGWSNWLTQPSESYVEIASLGPVREREIEWIEINPTEVQKLGRLIAPRQVDHMEEIIGHLTEMGVPWECASTKFIRVMM